MKKRQEIYFNEQAASNEFRLAEHKLKLVNAAFLKAKTLANKLTPDEFLESPYQSLEDAICSGVRIDGMTIKPKKILELQEVNIDWAKDVVIDRDTIEVIDGEFVLVDGLKDLIDEKFTSFTETESENILLSATEKLIDAIKEYQEIEKQAKVGAVAEITRRVASRNPYNGRLEVNPTQLKAIASTINPTRHIV